MSIAHRSGRQRLRSADLSRRARRGGRGTPHQPLRVVALGGGHGLAANLRALRLLADDITAVVTVADNGGSSGRIRDRKSTRLNSSHVAISYAVFCLKKKKK